MIWAVLAVGAALFQTGRFVLLKNLSDAGLSPVGSTFSRYAYSLPLGLLVLWAWMSFQGSTFPELTPRFWIFVTIGALGQMLATVCVIALFKRRHFAVGTILKKTETLQAAYIGFIILGDTLSIWSVAAMIVGLIGVLILSDQGTKISLRGFLTPSAGLGLLSGLLFGFAAIGYRGAGLALEGDDVFLRATVTLVISLFIQVGLLRFYLGFWEKEEIIKVVQSWRTAIWVGVFSILASLCWFNAFILQNAALVNAIGQVEVIFSLAASWFIFSERITKREYIGSILVVASVMLLIFL